MKIERLDHVNIRTAQLETMVAWYEDILGLKRGPRPDFGFPGAWLYAGEDAIVHLVTVEGEPGAGSEQPLKIEHAAFAATGLAAFEAHLKARGEKVRRVEIADFGITQLNIWDPDGNHLHVDFRNGE